MMLPPSSGFYDGIDLTVGKFPNNKYYENLYYISVVCLQIYYWCYIVLKFRV